MKTKIKAVNLPDDINSALSYLADNHPDFKKPSELLRLALAIRYKLADEVKFSAEQNHIKYCSTPYYFQIPEAMHKLMRNEKEKTGMTDQAIIISSFRRIVNFY
jgi:hypothetical protein